MLLEVIVQTVADAKAAAEGGADRLEVVRDIRQGGLTPPVALVRAIQAETGLPLRVMVRANGGYALEAGELPALREATAAFAALAVDGIVVGFARGGEPDLDDVRRVLEAAPEVRATFHRAFDQLRDPLGAIAGIAAIPQVDRILTDGGGGDAAARSRRLRECRARADGRLVILAGGGVDAAMFEAFVRDGCVEEIHVGTAAREGGDPEGPVSADRVRRLKTFGR